MKSEVRLVGDKNKLSEKPIRAVKCVTGGQDGFFCCCLAVDELRVKRGKKCGGGRLKIEVFMRKKGEIFEFFIEILIN